jgi:hypothetical protein
VGIGGQYQYNPRWRITGGFSFDSRLANDKNRSLAIPLGDMWRYCIRKVAVILLLRSFFHNCFPLSADVRYWPPAVFQFSLHAVVLLRSGTAGRAAD